ncbi:MAG: type IV toxin-antitoxin system AbiEi family antitoxin domain-containing protein [Sciscionella sp.]
MQELTDEVPAAAQIAVARGTHRPRIEYPLVEVSEFDRETFALGREPMEVAQAESVAVYSPARSVVDVMRLRERVGESLALRALRRYVERRDARLADLASYARALGVEGPVRRAVEVMTS